MSAPLAEQLSRFTPDATGLNRDALLFAAGRASVRTNRTWQALAGALALSQMLTLVMLWPRTPPPDTTPTVAATPSLPYTMPAPAADPDATEWRVLRQHMFETDFEKPSTSNEEPVVPADPPLRVYGPVPSYLLN